MKIKNFEIHGRKIGPSHPTYVIAELSANHSHDYETAVKAIKAAKSAGADAIKLQTYTADTLTIPSTKSMFVIRGGTLWDGRSLYELYGEAYTPWHWQPKLKRIANSLGLDFFSTAFDASAVDFLEKMHVPVHKVASFELVDIPLIQKMARTGKPLIMSTGMATVREVQEAVLAARNAGAKEIALLKCTSAYPAPPEDIHLRTIPYLFKHWAVPVGISDHTTGIAIVNAAVALGACIVEKHFTLSRKIKSADAAFSLEPKEFKSMVDSIRLVEKAMGRARLRTVESEKKSRMFRRSLFAVKDIAKGDVLNESNIRSIRPAFGLPPKFFSKITGRKAACRLSCGEPLRWRVVGKKSYRSR